ncbi:MAG: PAS domain S-box protein [Candidatus Atribacteria bacterium]|nr:PAS domain S-box protein [Candidatus Atribacteria bacterium]
MPSITNLKTVFQKSNIYLVLVISVLFVIILSYISYYELQREKNYLWELARSEGLNIAFSIQTLGAEFILNNEVLKEVLKLFQKEGITFIDVLNRDGVVLMSTDEQRTNQQIEIHYPGTVNYLQISDGRSQNILLVIKPFDFEDHFSSDLFGYLFLRDKYLLIGIHLEDYYLRYNQTKRRVIFNYLVIFIISLLGVYMIFRIQESLVVKKTLNNIKDYTTKLLETMDSGVISVDKQNMIKTFNQKSEQIFQLSKNEVIDKNAKEVLPISIDDQSIYDLGLEEEKKIEREIEFFTKDHTKKTLELNTSLLSSESDRDGGMVILVRDVSQIKKLSEEIDRNKRLTSLGKLSSGIAHEIRNPLSSIRGLAQFLFQSFHDTDERKADLEIILKEVDRLNQLVNQILDFSKPKELNIDLFSVNELIDEVVYLVKQGEKDKQIAFQLKLDKTEPLFEVDRDQIRQALLNIIINSVQAIPKEGEIIISSEKIILNDREMIQVIIQDNGVGIEKTDLSRIFDPFFTTRDRGIGLGLSIAYSILELHQGTIEIESEKFKGTKTRISLPLRR